MIGGFETAVEATGAAGSRFFQMSASEQPDGSSRPGAAAASAGAKPARRRGRGRLLPKLMLAGASFAIFLGLAEVVLRLAGFGNVEIYEPDRRLFWRLKPNQDCFTKVDHKPVHINSRGVRGAEFAMPKPPGTIRILSVGDSKTFGWGMSETETYARRLEALLQPQAPAGTRVEVINAGVNAWSYPQIKVFLQEHGMAWQPDYVLLADANLWTQFSEDSDPAFVDQMLSRVRLKNMLRRSAIYHFVIEVQLAQVYARYRTKFIPIDPKQDQLFKEAQKSDPDAVFKQAIEDVCRLAVTNRARPVLMYIPILTDLEAGTETNVQKAKREIAQRLGVPFVDFTGDLKAEGGAVYLDADPVHLNVKGNEIVARRLAETFRGLLLPAGPQAAREANGEAKTPGAP